MRTLAIASLLLLGASACRLKGDPTTDAASASCRSVTFSCAEHADCCSFGCVAGICVPNSVPNGVCRTSDDCVSTMTCVGGHCAPGATCRSIYGPPGAGDSCTSNNMCCSGNCVGDTFGVPGTCDANHDPVVVNVGPAIQPFFASTTLSASASDPDAGDTLQYVWRLQSAPAGSGLAAAWGSSAVHPTVFLAAPGTYVFGVTVTDRLAGQRDPRSASGTVTVEAVNLAPVVAAGADVPSLLRNHALPFTGTVFDPNLLATTVRCAWYARPPGVGAAEVLLQAHASCPTPTPGVGYTASATFSPGIDDPQGDWTLRLEAFDGQYLTSDTRTVTVVNAAPVPVACPGCAAPPDARVVNLRPPGDPVPASLTFSGTATDQNSDVATPGFTWSWKITEHDGVPLVDPVVLGTGDGGAPPFVATFEPGAVGTYAAVLHVEDGHGGVAEATVVALVEPFVRPLMPIDGGLGLPRGSIADAAYFHAATAAGDRLVFVGSETASGPHRLWILDPETPGTVMPVGTATSLGAAPEAFAVKPDGTEATVVTSARAFVSVNLSGTPAVTQTGTFAGSWTGPATDVLYAARTYAVSSAGAVHELGPSANQNTSEPARSCTSTLGCGVTGTRGTFADGYVWLATPTGGGAADLQRHAGRSNGLLELAGTASSGLTTGTSIWVSADDGGGRDVLAANGNVYDATTAALVDALPASARHVDSIAPGGVRSGILVDSVGSAVTLLDASWNAAGTLRVPRVGYQGTGHQPEAFYAFVRSDGSARYVLFRATVQLAPRWYLVRY